MNGRPADSTRPGTIRVAVIGAMVIVVTLLHYNTAVHIHQAHGIYRRLYYFPIIFAAFQGGWRAGLMTAMVICAVYIPHAFGWIGYDPAPTLEKILEMILYNAVGLVTGILVSREGRTRRSLEDTAVGLRTALEQKAAMEGELVRAARLAAVGRLSAGLAHEIRNPLASIKGAAELLADDFPAVHAKGKLLRVLVEETERLDDVLTRFLAFARPLTSQWEDVDLAAEIAHVAGLMRHRGNTAPLVLDISADRAGGWTVSADRAQIRQLLWNICLNGAEAAGATGKVVVTLADNGDQVVCRVTDDGPGFSREAVENFGAPFFTTKENGTGLGLAICHRIVEDLGGSLDVTAAEGGGACVSIAVPRRKPRM